MAVSVLNSLARQVIQQARDLENNLRPTILETLGLEPAGTEGGLRFYSLGDGTAVAVDVSGAMAGEPPYLVFSATDLAAAAEHFLQRGCSVRELPWATGSGFLARAPEGHTVCVVQDASDESA